MTNRIIAAVNHYESIIANGISAGRLTPLKLDALQKSLDLPLGEYCMFQERKTLAVADGRLTMDEGATVYAYLGNTVEHFNQQPVAVKATLTKVFSELLSPR